MRQTKPLDPKDTKPTPYEGDSSFGGAMACDPEILAEVEECEDELPAETKEYKTGWPEIEKDTAPHALLIPATRCMGRHLKKLDDLVKRYNAVPKAKLTTLQTQWGSQLSR